MKHYTRRVLAVFLMLVMLMGTMSVSTFAATQTKSVKKQTFSTRTNTIKKKAATVKKGTTKLVIKKGEGYVKFKAPKTKYYKFTFSNFKSKKFSSNGFIYIQKPDKYSPEYSWQENVKTKGGKSTTLWMSVNGYKHSGKLLYRPLAKRTGKIKLKKGETVYIYFYFSSSKHTGKVSIK